MQERKTDRHGSKGQGVPEPTRWIAKHPRSNPARGRKNPQFLVVQPANEPRRHPTRIIDRNVEEFSVDRDSRPAAELGVGEDHPATEHGDRGHGEMNELAPDIPLAVPKGELDQAYAIKRGAIVRPL